MSRKGYTLGSKYFKTKKAITDYFKDYLKNNQVDTYLEDEHLEVMQDLIKWHPMYENDWGDEFKTGCGDYGEKNFNVCNKNGDWWCFSYYKCISKSTKENNQRLNVINASRFAIQSQVDDFLESKEIENDDGIVKYLCEIDQKLYEYLLILLVIENIQILN